MSSTRTLATNRLAEAYRQIKDRIAEAALRSGRAAQDIMLVAVTKTASPDQIRKLVEMGQVDLAENRVQQLVQRVAMLDEFLSRKRTLHQKPADTDSIVPSTVRWHMVGHLQRNKIKPVVPVIQLIHSVDSLRVAEELHNFAAHTDQVVDILIQVNTSRETTKFGVLAPAVVHLAQQIDTMMNLRLRGLMAMAPVSDDPEDARPTFSRAAEIFADLQSAKAGGPACNILSMGMTNDFEVAIEEGANLVRIGRGLFGEGESA